MSSAQQTLAKSIIAIYGIYNGIYMVYIMHAVPTVLCRLYQINNLCEMLLLWESKTQQMPWLFLPLTCAKAPNSDKMFYYSLSSIFHPEFVCKGKDMICATWQIYRYPQSGRWYDTPDIVCFPVFVPWNFFMLIWLPLLVTKFCFILIQLNCSASLLVKFPDQHPIVLFFLCTDCPASLF